MIPKIIHYCWLSDDEKPDIVKECLESWDILKEQGFEFMLWDRNMFDVESSVYTKSCWDNKLYAFICDYVRLKALYEYGGIYMDCDVLLLKPFDDFILNNDYFFTDNYGRGITASVMCADKGNDFIGFSKKHYEENILPYPVTKRKMTIMEEKLRYIYHCYHKKLVLNDAEYFAAFFKVTDKSYTSHQDIGSWSEYVRKMEK